MPDSDRTPAQIRSEIDAERQELAGDLDVLHSELRSLVPVALLGVVALALLSRKSHLRTGVKLLWKLR